MFYRHIQGVLSAEECQELIARGHAMGFEQALVNNYGTDELLTNIRNNERVQFDDEQLSTRLSKLLMTSLLEDFPFQYNDRHYAKAGTRFRMYRYTLGQYFKPHRDGSFQDQDLQSEITVLFYLNDADGGETVLMPYGLQQKWAHIVIQPKAGDVLMFAHNTWHEGRPVNSGKKYVLRTDLFYA